MIHEERMKVVARIVDDVFVPRLHSAIKETLDTFKKTILANYNLELITGVPSHVTPSKTVVQIDISHATQALVDNLDTFLKHHD